MNSNGKSKMGRFSVKIEIVNNQAIQRALSEKVFERLPADDEQELR